MNYLDIEDKLIYAVAEKYELEENPNPLTTLQEKKDAHMRVSKQIQRLTLEGIHYGTGDIARVNTSKGIVYLVNVTEPDILPLIRQMDIDADLINIEWFTAKKFHSIE